MLQKIDELFEEFLADMDEYMIDLANAASFSEMVAVLGFHLGRTVRKAVGR